MNSIYPILLPALFLGGIISIVAGGGLGIIMLIVFSAFFDIRSSIVLMSLYGFVIQGMKIWHFHKYAQWQTIVWFVALGLPASAFGGWLMYLIPALYVQIAVSVMCFLFVAIRLYHHSFRLHVTRLRLLMFGAITGLVGGIIGNATLLRTPFLLSMGLKKEVFIGTTASIAFLMNIGKVSTYMMNFKWTPEVSQMLIFSLPFLLTGMYIGKRLLHHVSENLFEKLLLTVIFIGALRLLITAL